MRSPLVPLLLSASLVALVACGSVDEPPLGGPFGGSTNPTDPNGDNSSNDNNNNDPNGTTDDAGSTGSTNQDSGQPNTADAGSQSKDSGTTVQDSGTQQQQNTAPTWTSLFNDYMKSGTKGKCSSCHSQGSSASNLYSWLKGRGYINGTSSTLVNSSKSCLSWYGGNMPPSGPSSYGNAGSDMSAWAAAGAANN